MLAEILQIGKANTYSEQISIPEDEPLAFPGQAHQVASWIPQGTCFYRGSDLSFLQAGRAFRGNKATDDDAQLMATMPSALHDIRQIS